MPGARTKPAMSHAPKGNPTTKAAACHQGGPLSAMRVAAATSPLMPAIRPVISKNSAAAVPISRPPSVVSGMEVAPPSYAHKIFSGSFR